MLQRLTQLEAWINDYSSDTMWGVISDPNFNGGLAERPFMLEYG